MYMAHAKLELMIFIIYLLSLQFVESANWAQTSGYLEQNVVIPAIPSPAVKHWQPRYGMSSLQFPNASSANGNLVLLGGDTYNNDFTGLSSSPGLIDLNWGSGYKNDVWSTDGTIWLVHSDIRLRGSTGYSRQKIPNIRSLFKWTLITSGRLPPRSMSYDDWIFCQPYFNQVIVLILLIFSFIIFKCIFVCASRGIGKEGACCVWSRKTVSYTCSGHLEGIIVLFTFRYTSYI